MQPSRTSQLAKIHLGKKLLQLDDDTYRAMLQSVAGVDSASKLKPADLNRVIEHMKSKGAVFKKRFGKHTKQRPKNMTPQMQKIEALLTDMKLPWGYADAMAKHMFKIEKVAWVRETSQLQGIITALTKKQQWAKK